MRCVELAAPKLPVLSRWALQPEREGPEPPRQAPYPMAAQRGIEVGDVCERDAVWR